MICLRNVRKEGNLIKADYYPEGSTVCSEVSIDINTKEFKGELVGYELETEGHLGHAKFALWDMVRGEREIKDCNIMWY